jgi:hypothetical protein
MANSPTPEQQLQELEATGYIKMHLADCTREVYNTIVYKESPGPHTVKVASMLSKFHPAMEKAGNLVILQAMRFILFNRGTKVVADNLKQFGEEHDF